MPNEPALFIRKFPDAPACTLAILDRLLAGGHPYQEPILLASVERNGEVVGHALRRIALRKAGRRHVFLFTDIANPTPNAIYARIGYRPVADRVEIDFHPIGGPMPLDHYFIGVPDLEGGLAALANAGYAVDGPCRHPGQGTRGGFVHFAEAYLELLGPSDEEADLRSPLVAPLGLAERIRWRESGACPFGLCLRDGGRRPRPGGQTPAPRGRPGASPGHRAGRRTVRGGPRYAPPPSPHHPPLTKTERAAQRAALDERICYG